mgnify:CR=1 FL=1
MVTCTESLSTVRLVAAPGAPDETVNTVGTNVAGASTSYRRCSIANGRVSSAEPVKTVVPPGSKWLLATSILIVLVTKSSCGGVDTQSVDAAKLKPFTAARSSRSENTVASSTWNENTPVLSVSATDGQTPVPPHPESV